MKLPTTEMGKTIHCEEKVRGDQDFGFGPKFEMSVRDTNGDR